MKSLSILVSILCVSVFVNAQSWTASISAGPAIYKDINMGTRVGEDAVNERGWNAEAGINYTTKAYWSFGFGINGGQYATQRSYNGFGGAIDVMSTEEAYALYFKADYDILRKLLNRKSGKLGLTIGGTIAPVLYHERITTHNYTPQYDPSKSSSNYLGILLGVQAQINYSINSRWSVYIKPSMQLDPARIANNDYVGSEADFRGSLLVGSSFRIH